MKIKDVMTTDVAWIGADSNASEAARIMWEHDCGCVPVVDSDGMITGIVTDRDVCMAAYTQGLELARIPVSAVMAKQVITCKTEDTSAEALTLMRLHQVRRLPVLDAEGRIVGLVSLNDLVRRTQYRGNSRADIRATELAETLAEICHPRSPVPAVLHVA
jgi:CBS domain-containing protein